VSTISLALACSLAGFGFGFGSLADLYLTPCRSSPLDGRRYGLIGLNGSGKSTFLRCVGRRDVPIPSHVDIFLLEREVEPTDLTPIQCVLELREKEVTRLEREADLLLETEDGPESERLQQIYERLYEELDLEKAKPRAAEILHGLGFTPEMQSKASREFSGGWRMV